MPKLEVLCYIFVYEARKIKGAQYFLCGKFELNNLNKVSKEDKFKIIAKYCLGFLDNEYLPMCEYCNGYGDEVNKKMVNAGE